MVEVDASGKIEDVESSIHATVMQVLLPIGEGLYRNLGTVMPWQQNNIITAP